MNPMLNKVINRFLPITVSVAKGLEAEPKITDFEVIKQIGEGSFGRVYLARHKSTQMVYAIKEINKLNKNNQEGKPYFRREIEIMYKIHHPNVVKLYSNFEDDKNCYFAMEYVKEGNLFDQDSWRRYHCLTSSDVAKYMKDLISAVYYLHNMSPPIIHRDIKPENVLINEHGRAKLTDFGWSNYVNSEVRSTYCGTPVYLAPEMIREIGHDANLDIWCIGILMFELLTGNVPFRGKDFQSLNENILNLKIQWPKDINIDAKNLISKILKPEPKDRLSLVNILKHQFFAKHLGDCDLLTQCLVKPSINENSPPFILSKDVIKEEKEDQMTKNDNLILEQNINENESNKNNQDHNGQYKMHIQGQSIEEIQNDYEQLSRAYKSLLISKNQLQKKLVEVTQRQFNMDKEKNKLIIEIEEKKNEIIQLMNTISDLKQSLLLKDQQISILSSNILETQTMTHTNTNNLTEEDYELLIKEKEQENQSKLLKMDVNALNTELVDKHLANFHESIKKINETLSIQLTSHDPDEFQVYKSKMEAQLKMTKEYLEKEILNIRNENKKEKEQLTLLLKIKEEEIRKIALINEANKNSENEKVEKIMEKYKTVLKTKESEMEVLKLKNKKMEMMYNAYMKKEKEKEQQEKDTEHVTNNFNINTPNNK